jgi:hypothetical protein
MQTTGLNILHTVALAIAGIIAAVSILTIQVRKRRPRCC